MRLVWGMEGSRGDLGCSGRGGTAGTKLGERRGVSGQAGRGGGGGSQGEPEKAGKALLGARRLKVGVCGGTERRPGSWWRRCRTPGHGCLQLGTNGRIRREARSG